MANFDPSRAIFSQVDANNDGSIDQNEFNNFLGGNSSSYQSFGGGLGGSAGYSSQSGYESADDFAAGGLQNAYASGASSLSISESAQAGGASFESSTVQLKSPYPSAGGLYDDPDPQFIRREAVRGPITYQQKIAIRFLQPPPVPPHGPLIIREVRPPQPPPPAPLVVRQRAPPLPQAPPLVLRERPPRPPVVVASQTVIRRLAGIPVPPRSVIIERLPALPPRPRDILLERWVPYGTQAKRRTIVQRAGPAKAYARPRNIIIVYDAVQARVVRQFQRFAVTPENPQIYVSRYGQSLLDSSTLVQQARAAGVVEDISTPVAQSNALAFGASGASFSGSASFGGAQGGVYAVDAGSDGNYASQSYSSSSNFGSEGGYGGGDLVDASFAALDANADGGLDRDEFERFIQAGL